MPTRYIIQPIRPEQTHRLRHTVLRPHQRLDEMVYDGDDDPTSLHLGAFRSGDTEGQAVGVLTLNHTPMPGLAAPGDFRLRGMAVDPAVQGEGVGRMLVERLITEASTRGARRLWCNARVSAMGFYEKLGFVTHGEVFQIAPIGPHYVMSVAITARSR